MRQISIPENDPILKEVLDAYAFPATLLGAVRYVQGHINDTFFVLCQPQEGDCIRFILQGLSLAAFPHPDELMENFVGITSYLRKKIIAQGGDPLRETLSLVKTRKGEDYFTDSSLQRRSCSRLLRGLLAGSSICSGTIPLRRSMRLS